MGLGKVVNLKQPSVSSPIDFLLILMVCLFGALRIGIQQADARVQGEIPAGSGVSQGLPSNAYAAGNYSVLPQQTSVSSPTHSPTPTLLVEAPGTATPFGRSPIDSDQHLLAFVHAPSGLVPQPFVVLMAFESTPGVSVEVRGYENLREFICTGFPCALPLQGSSTLRFSAYNSAGEKSPEVIATIRVESGDDGYYVIIDSVSQFSLYRDACSGIWNIRDTSDAAWSRFPESPFQLNTNKTLHLLAARLIANGIVDAQDCPFGGVGGDLNYPTGCGIERARPKMIEWQNRYDFTIWSTSLDVGIPPRILKTLIDYESQYWPANARFYLDEFGLGQINQLGIDVLLRQDPTFYHQVCPTVFSDCSLPYTSLDPAAQAIIRGAVINSIDAACPTCEYGLDLEKANQSIPLIAQLLRANCQMVDYLGKPSVTYEDMWKYTLATYHSGFSCVRDAVRVARENKETEDWETVSSHISCRGTKRYVDGFWGSLVTFDSYLVHTSPLELAYAVPTFLPTPTPILAPTEIPSTAQISVRVYMDINGNGMPEENELLDGIAVDLVVRGEEVFSSVTRNGEVVFQPTGFPPGTDVFVRLPGLYREHFFSLPADGIVQIDFVFTAPIIPGELP
jgi:hypothetical protein